MAVSEVALLNIPSRPTELGRIRLGEKGPRGEPRRLTTFRLTSGNRKLLEAAAALYGGKVESWPEAPDEGYWQLRTTSAELDVLIPGAHGSVTQGYELWKGGTLERRCDGTQEQLSGAACMCSDDPAERECELMTRVNVMLPRIPGLGVWRLDTSGWQAATSLPATLGLLVQLTRGAWIPASLRAEQRSKRVRLPSGKTETHRFVVPVLDLPGATVGELAQLAGLTAPVEQLEAGERPIPPTARERVAQRRAAVESAQGGGEPEPQEAAVGDVPTTPTPAAAAEANAPAQGEEVKSAASSPDLDVDIRAEVERVFGDDVVTPTTTELLPLAEFSNWVRDAKIAWPDIERAAKELFPGKTVARLNDEQRGQLKRALL
jgi:hypothetical protein